MYSCLQIGVTLSNGKQLFAKTVISNATRWDTFGNPAKLFFNITSMQIKLALSVLLVEAINFLSSKCQENS
jgi:hypothetical protein